MKDVQLLTGHSALGTTQRYIESDRLAQRRVVEISWNAVVVKVGMDDEYHF